jgi:2,4-dichlorophenol 6-monooxygenase
VDCEDLEDAWAGVSGLASDGAILVRPDRIVAWRVRTIVPHPGDELVYVLHKILDAGAC